MRGCPCLRRGGAADLAIVGDGRHLVAVVQRPELGVEDRADLRGVRVRACLDLGVGVVLVAALEAQEVVADVEQLQPSLRASATFSGVTVLGRLCTMTT